MQDVLDQMTQRVLRHADRAHALPRVGMAALWKHSTPAAHLCGPGVCLILQGAKQMAIGGQAVRYGAGSCFASLLELPASRRTFETDGDRPYVATSLTLDPIAVAALVEDLPVVRGAPSFSVASVSPVVLDAWDRYLGLLDAPADMPALAAPRECELLYRLLQSPHGPVLRQIARQESRLVQVRRALDWMRGHVSQPISIAALADLAGMSVPSFNRHFRAATSTSPLQYHKTLRLQAARRLLAANGDVARAAYAVGYESASQFSREYARLFGRPPTRDAR